MLSSRLSMVTAPPFSALIIMMSFFCLSCCSASRSSVDRLYVFLGVASEGFWSICF